MQNLTISLSENVLKVSLIEKGEFKGVSADITSEIVDDNQILNVNELGGVLSDLISNLTNKNPKNFYLNFLIDPEDVFLNFVTVNKKDGDVEDQVIKEVSSKLDQVTLNELYFAYAKIAPFVYQFVGIKKETLNKYLELSNIVGASLRSVSPWILFFPLFVKTNEPAIFISSHNGNQNIALSEFGGIFYTGSYETQKSAEEIKKLVKELSIYKRTDPITKIYTYNYKLSGFSDEYKVSEIQVPNSDLEEAKGYELHLLVDYMLDRDDHLMSSYVNLLNLLPLPQTQEKSKVPMVYVGSAMAVLLLLGAIAGGAYFLNNRNSGEVPLNNNVQDNVLSENSTNENVQNQEQDQGQEQEQEETELNKEDISIRVENGAGIPGVAGRTQTFLEEQGYTVSGVGNADQVGRETTIVRTTQETAPYFELLEQDMSENFTLEQEDTLEEGLDYNVLIIIGTDAQI